MKFMKRALTLPTRRVSYEDEELSIRHYSKLDWKLAKQEAEKTRKILGPDASPAEILRVTSERLETSAPAPTPVEEKSEMKMETEKEEEVKTFTLEPVKDERELEMVAEEEVVPGLTCGDIHVTDSEWETVSFAPKPFEKPVEKKHELKTEKKEETDSPTPEPLEQESELEMEKEETGIPGLTWSDIDRTKAFTQTKLAALMTCW
jgi:hypothetical protein